jgi:DNA-binding FrmR family transcriptional regulator
LARIEEIVLADHLGHCVEQAIISGDPDEQRKKVAELIEVFSRSDR